MKRFLAFLGILVVMGIILGAGYYFRYRGGQGNGTGGGSSEYPLELPDTQPASAGGSDATGLPSNSKFGPISEDAVAGYSVRPDGSILLVRTDGQVVKINRKSREVLSGTTLPELTGAWFSSDGGKLVVGYDGGRSPRYSLFDIASKAWTQLEGVIRPVWSPADGRLGYISTIGGMRRFVTLDTADPKAKPVIISDMTMEDVALSWPSPNLVLVNERPSSKFEGSAWLLDLKQGIWTRIAEDRLGLETLWSFAGDKGIEFRANANQRGGTMFMLDASGRETKQFEILTLPEKCSFIHSYESSTPAVASTTTSTKRSPPSPDVLVESLWCAVPVDQPSLSRRELPDEYGMGAFGTSDDIYVIDPETGSILVPAASPAPFDAILLSRAGERIYFVNRTDNRLYSLDLPEQNPS